jgi:hypothetical protein
VPLSEEELRLLEQMERALLQEDPKFASTLRGTALRRAQHRRAILAGVVLVGGVALLMAGVITGVWVVGVIGFLVMLGATTVGLSAVRGRPVLMHLPHLPHRSSGGGSLRHKVDQRWRRRRHGESW